MKIKATLSRAADYLCGLAARLILRSVDRMTIVVNQTVTRYVRVLVKPAPALRVSKATASPEAARKAGQLLLPLWD